LLTSKRNHFDFDTTTSVSIIPKFLIVIHHHHHNLLAFHRSSFTGFLGALFASIQVSTLASSAPIRFLLSAARENIFKMAASAATGIQMTTARPCMSSSNNKLFKAGAAIFGSNFKVPTWVKLTSSSYISSTRPSSRSLSSLSMKTSTVVPKAMPESTGKSVSGLPIDLKGKKAFIAGVADDNGYGWAIAKSLAAAGAEILVGTWVPALNIFETSLRRGKFDESRVLPDGSLMEITKVYPLDAVFDSPEDVPEDVLLKTVKANKRYAGSSKWTVKEVVESVKEGFGSIDILVHSLANGPEVTKPLLETSRNGYLAALSASSYSYVSLLKHFLPIINPGMVLFSYSCFCPFVFLLVCGSSISLTYIASERIIPGYGGGMSSAKAALESDTKVLAFEAGRKHKVRVNTISAGTFPFTFVLQSPASYFALQLFEIKFTIVRPGPLRSRAAKAIGFIDMMIDYSIENAPLQKELSAEEVGNTAAFLASPLASAITGAVIYVDNGLNAMGVGVDSPIFEKLDIPRDKH
ncbi:Enoyl-[acyl-carrier-protein] reductase [NADH], chloroplastic-like protein, partial [Drosera capensis]